MIINGIDTKDISVVVQGAIDKENTPKCLKSIRKYLPEAEIILSTWEGSNVSGLDYDVLVLSKDPGGFYDTNTYFVNNTLRQLVSTQSGVSKTSKPYILKTRSDIIFLSNKFLIYFDKFAVKDEQYSIFKHRIIFPSFFTKLFCCTPSQSQPLPFHVSDWLAFGLKDDMKFLYDIPLPNEPENSFWLTMNKYDGVKIDLLKCSHRYAPEQYIFYTACKKNISGLRFEHYLDYDVINIEKSHKIILNNCIILDPWQFKFVCGKQEYKKWTEKYSALSDELKNCLYMNRDFVNDYEKYLIKN